jgi:hypothetical protein
MEGMDDIIFINVKNVEDYFFQNICEWCMQKRKRELVRRHLLKLRDER